MQLGYSRADLLNVCGSASRWNSRAARTFTWRYEIGLRAWKEEIKNEICIYCDQRSRGGIASGMARYRGSRLCSRGF